MGGVPNVFNEPGTPSIMAEIEIEINKALLCFSVYELYKEHIKTGFRYDDWWKPLRTFFAYHKSAYLDLSVVQIGLDHRFFGGFLASFMQTRITIRNKTCVYIKLNRLSARLTLLECRLKSQLLWSYHTTSQTESS